MATDYKHQILMHAPKIWGSAAARLAQPEAMFHDYNRLSTEAPIQIGEWIHQAVTDHDCNGIHSSIPTETVYNHQGTLWVALAYTYKYREIERKRERDR